MSGENAFIFTVFGTIISVVLAVTFYQYNQLKVMEKNVETAVAKGIDPLAVRCAYANQTDVICVAYASKVSK